MTPNRVKMYEALGLLDLVGKELTSNRANYLPLRSVLDLIVEYIKLLRKEIERDEKAPKEKTSQGQSEQEETKRKTE